VFDRFHIMKHMVEAVDSVRKAEHRRLQAAGDDTLKRSKYLWLFSAENLPERYKAWFARLKALELKTGRAWAIKESLRRLWTYRRKGWATRFWKEWYFWATHSRLRPVVKVARMLQSHLANVLTYCDHGITNATSEGLNSKIQTVKKRLRFSQSRALEDRHLLSLRWIGLVSQAATCFSGQFCTLNEEKRRFVAHRNVGRTLSPIAYLLFPTSQTDRRIVLSA